jgi:hypothetical protein
MSTTTRIDWGLFRKRFFIAFIGALLFGVLTFFVTGCFREERQGVVLLSAAALLWCICAGLALRRKALLYVFTVATALTWGFFLSLSAAISFQNGHVSVWWPTMIPGLLIIPPVATVTIFPFWYLSRRRHIDVA